MIALKYFHRILAAVFLTVLCMAHTALARADGVITFYSHDFGEKFPHAFFTNKGELSSGTAIDTGYGFTATQITPAILMGSVKGHISSPAKDYIANSNAHFTIMLDDEKVAKVLAITAEWEQRPGRSYSLNRRNCVHFIRDILIGIGVKTNPDSGYFKKPKGYLREVLALNPSLSAAPVLPIAPALPETELNHYLTQLARLDTVSARLFETARPLCSAVGRDPGLYTAPLKAFEKSIRPSAHTAFNPTGHIAANTPIVIYVREGGPAQPVQIGDILIGEDNAPVGANDKAVQTYLAAGFLRLQRDSQTMIVPANAPLRCAYRAVLKPDKDIAAKLSGGHISVTTGLMDFISESLGTPDSGELGDDALAYVIGHELAHGINGHMKSAILSGGLLGLSQNKMKRLEREADYFGLTIANASGYQTGGGPAFWQRMATLEASRANTGSKVSAYRNRASEIQADAEQIRAKMLNGQPLADMQKPPQ